ncbi:MAG: NAD(P)/FAD-dependent oxidoreductase [Pseudomonadota bacterium]
MRKTRTMTVTQENTASKPEKIVIVGGGFAGLSCAKRIKPGTAEVTLIDQRNHHLFQPLLYQVATAILPTSDVAWPIRRLFRDRPDITTLLGRVTAVDQENKEVTLADGERIPFDTLVLATGARHSYFGNDQWEQDAPGLKTLEDATTIRRRVLSAFEAAERASNDEERDAYLTFAVIGAGPTGVELAGIIAELAHEILPQEFRHIDTRKAKVLLVEAGPRVLAAFPEKLSAYAEDALVRLGVEVLKGEPVTEITDDGIKVADDWVPTKTTIWAAGVEASGASRWVGATADRAKRALVEPNLTLPNNPGIFIIGDTASVKDAKGVQVPGIAPAAKQQGKYVAAVINRRLAGRKAPGPFVYRHQGNLATIGPRAAVVDLGWITLKGTLAWWVWGLAHVYFLIGTRSRLAVAMSWLWSYVSGQNSARLITQGKRESATKAGNVHSGTDAAHAKAA